MGMTERAINHLVQGNVDTMGKVAFAVGQPGHPLDNNEFVQFAQNTLGALINQADTAVLKRLVFEGHTLVLGQLRELVSDPNAAASRKLPAVEREHRLTQLRHRLTGVILERQLEPSHELLETVMQQKESNQLVYIQLERCTSREWEITMGKNRKQISLDSERLVVKEKSEIPDQFHSSELQAFEALRRRGVALAFADILSWESHERYLQQLTSHLRQDPPPNYLRTTLPQILKADRQVFLHMIRSGIDLRRLPDGTLQMDKSIFTALESYEVGFHLLPLPKLAQKADAGPVGVSAASPSNTKGGSWESYRPHPYKGKGRGGGKSKGKGGKAVLPKFLLGRDNVGMDSHGRRLCFNYQVGRCNDAADGAECARGWHLCARKGCHAPHPEQGYDAKKR